MRHKNMTFSIPDDLILSLHSQISKRGISRFISEAIHKALEAEMLQREQSLESAYEAANQDSDRLEVLQEWNTLDDVSDLIDDENWDWLRNSIDNGKLKHG